MKPALFTYPQILNEIPRPDPEDLETLNMNPKTLSGVWYRVSYIGDVSETFARASIDLHVARLERDHSASLCVPGRGESPDEFLVERL